MNIKRRFENREVDEKCTYIRHKSGLDIYIVKKDFASAYAVLGTKYGSCDNRFRYSDEKEITVVPAGIAHFLEHKMFEDENGEDTFYRFAMLGADANAYTSTDTTAYLFSCTDNIYQSLETLFSMVTTPHFTEESIENERGIIAEEIRMCEDRPADAIHYNLIKAMYGEGNPSSLPIAGTVESICNITPGLMNKCYKTFYRMSNMVLSVCGNVEEDKIEEIADRMLQAVPEREIIRETREETADVFREEISVRKDVSRPLYRIGIKFPEATSENESQCNVLAEAMFSENEDFYSDIFESGLINTYSYGYEYGRMASYYFVGGDASDPMEVYRRFKKYLKNITANGIPYDAYERAKRSLYADILGSFDSDEEIAENYFDYATKGKNFINSSKEYENVTYQQISELIKKIADEKRYAISIVYPIEDK